MESKSSIGPIFCCGSTTGPKVTHCYLILHNVPYQKSSSRIGLQSQDVRELRPVSRTIFEIEASMAINDDRPATKRDLDELRTASRTDLDELRVELRAATKRDLDELRTATRTDLDELRVELRTATKTDLDGLRTELRTEVTHLHDDLVEKMRDMQTEVLRAFHSWASPLEIRMRALPQLDERLSLLEERVSRIERGQSSPSA
jgi:hypothetical protein